MTVVALLLVAAAAPVASFAPGMALRSTVHPAQCGETRARDPVEDSEVIVTPVHRILIFGGATGAALGIKIPSRGYATSTSFT